MKQLLITAFEPFGGRNINSSKEALKLLQHSFPQHLYRVLPVDFVNSFTQLQEVITSHDELSGIIMLGQAEGRTHVCLEKVALNWKEHASFEMDKIFEPCKIKKEGPDAVMSELPLEKWIPKLTSIGSTKISYTAGVYVCNFLYYMVLNYLKNSETTFSNTKLKNLTPAHNSSVPSDSNPPALFVHLPLCTRQENEPHMELKTQVAVLSKLMEIFTHK